MRLQAGYTRKRQGQDPPAPTRAPVIVPQCHHPRSHQHGDRRGEHSQIVRIPVSGEAEEHHQRDEPRPPQHEGLLSLLPEWKARTPLPTPPTCSNQAHDGQRQKPPYLPAKLWVEEPQRSWISDILVAAHQALHTVPADDQVRFGVEGARTDVGTLLSRR